MSQTPRAIAWSALVFAWSSVALSPALASGGAGSPDWLSKVEHGLVEKEYEATDNGHGLQAPNRRHDFRTYFEADGIRLVERSAAGSPEIARVRIASIGRGAEQRAVPAGTVVEAGSVVLVQRSSGSLARAAESVSERFSNSPQGLRQTLTIAERPAGDGDLEVLFEVGTAAVERAEEGVELRAPSGRRLAMIRLPTTDAAGKLLPSRLEAAGRSRVRFSVGDRSAAYPLVVELLFTGPAATTLQGDQAGAQFGFRVAGAGDVNGDGYADVIVGAPRYDLGHLDEGAAFVFLGSASGIVSSGAASASATLQSNQVNAQLGTSVAGAGDVNGDGYADVLVGARFQDSGQADEGLVFVFLGSASGIANGNPATAATTLQGNQTNAAFGVSLAGAGDVNGDGYADVIVGANLYDAGLVVEGAAFVFMGGANGIASGGPANATTTLRGNQEIALFGSSVAGAGDVNGDGFGDVIVGASLWDSGQTDEGAAFVFLGSADGIANGSPATAAATLQGNQVSANFGGSVAGAGDVNGDGYADVLVGSQFYDSGEMNEGAAFVFLGSSAGVASGGPANAATTLQGNLPDLGFGLAVAGAGDVNGDGYADALVGSEFLACTFLGSASGIASAGALGATSVLQGPGSDAFAKSVAGAGDVNGDGYADILVGAYLGDFGETDEGLAYVFLGGASGITDNSGPAGAAATLLGNQVDAQFGFSVAGAGDVNADGYSDVVVGAPRFDSGETDEGVAFVFLGSASGIASAGSASAAAILQGNQVSSRFGFSVAGAGDVNGDGYADVIIGAVSYASGETDEGAAFVFLGGPSGISSGGPATAAATLQGNQLNASFGISVAGAGDVNGDGYADILVGAQGYDAGEINEGAAFVFLGGPSGISSGGPATAAATLEGNQTSAQLGFSVAGAGDVNGDGYADVVVGGGFFGSVEAAEGAAFVFLGSTSGIASGGPTSAATTLQGNQVGALFGYSVAGAGDVNGDGYADILVGSIYYDSGEVDEGAAFVFLGSAAGIASGGPAGAATTLQGNQANAQFGVSVAGAGDLNGDGYADIVVGANRYDSAVTDGGAALVFLGSALGVANGDPSASAAKLLGNQVGTDFGYSVASAGDVNGDGFADILVGALSYDSINVGGGAAFLFLGNERKGRPVLARQFRSGGSTPVQPWGASRGTTGFDARMSCYHPEGGGRVKLEIEACPAGKDFGMSGCIGTVSSSWSDATATSGLTLSQHVAGLTAARLYHWRARALYAPASVTRPGITAPPKPAHGPWRRLASQSTEADIRTDGGAFYTLVPCRVLDTRPGSGAPIGGPILTSGIERTLPVVNKCNIPRTARAISGNLTAVNPTGTGSLVVYPVAGATTPTSNLSFSSLRTRANNSMLMLNALGQVQVKAFVDNPAGADEVDLVLDVNGYFE